MNTHEFRKVFGPKQAHGGTPSRRIQQLEGKKKDRKMNVKWKIDCSYLKKSINIEHIWERWKREQTKIQTDIISKMHYITRKARMTGNKLQLMEQSEEK